MTDDERLPFQRLDAYVVAKEIADMVLLEDDFDQMAAAVEQGRTIHANIRRSLRYLVVSPARRVTPSADGGLVRTAFRQEQP